MPLRSFAARSLPLMTLTLNTRPAGAGCSGIGRVRVRGLLLREAGTDKAGVCVFGVEDEL